MARKVKGPARKSQETLLAAGGDPGEELLSAAATRVHVDVDTLSCALSSVKIGSERRTVVRNTGIKLPGSRQSVGKGADRERMDKVQQGCIKTSKPDSLQLKKVRAREKHIVIKSRSNAAERAKERISDKIGGGCYDRRSRGGGGGFPQQEPSFPSVPGGEPYYSSHWAEYYRSVGKTQEAEAIEAQMRVKGQGKQWKKSPKSHRENINPKRNNIEFWKDIITRSLSDVVKKPVNLNSKDLDRADWGPLRLTRLLVADFTCSSCNKHWDSTQVTVQVEYEANKVNFQGYIRIEEYGQRCKKCCGKFEAPVFDVDSSERMGMTLREKIMIKYYGVEAPQITEMEEHNRRERKKPHDSANCEACLKGICRAEERKSDNLFPKSRGQAGPLPSRFKKGITLNWRLSVGRKTRRI
eukprot:GFUD01023817.1.p1 GENE.GFUD01023817.1~~GFUD01023817.1.p1  ORF type:complete len:411 (+),score=105.01 GFUD01023817.1:95-1327(+)